MALNDIYQFEIFCNEDLPRDNILTVVWIHDNYNRYKLFMKQNVVQTFVFKERPNIAHLTFNFTEDEVLRGYYFMIVS